MRGSNWGLQAVEGGTVPPKFTSTQNSACDLIGKRAFADAVT